MYQTGKPNAEQRFFDELFEDLKIISGDGELAREEMQVLWPKIRPIIRRLEKQTKQIKGKDEANSGRRRHQRPR